MGLIAHLAPVGVSLPALKWVAVLCALAGAGVAMAGVVAFKRSQTTVNPFTPERASSLVASGIYRYSRNPMYLGFFLALIGWAAWLSNLLAPAVLPLFIAYMNRFQIQPEEGALRLRFGDEFQRYALQVRRWV
ncbi:MAG: hypothetical protein RI907_1114 [Pseudomonadota bacterium]